MGEIRHLLMEEVDVLQWENYDFHLELTVLRKGIGRIEGCLDRGNCGVKIPKPKPFKGIWNAELKNIIWDME